MIAICVENGGQTRAVDYHYQYSWNRDIRFWAAVGEVVAGAEVIDSRYQDFRFTAADVYVGSQIQWGLMFKSLPERDAFKAYAGRIAGRPAAARARELDDALMPKEG